MIRLLDNKTLVDLHVEGAARALDEDGKRITITTRTVRGVLKYVACDCGKHFGVRVVSPTAFERTSSYVPETGERCET